MTWLVVIEWAKTYWRYLAVGLACFLLGMGLSTFHEPIVNIQATQAQSGEIASSAHVTIKPKEPVIMAKGCPPCPSLPEISVDCGGSAKASQSQALTATASSTTHTGVSLNLGLSGAIQGHSGMGAGALLSYGKYSALGIYGFDGVWTVGGFVRVFEF